jgi:D-threo-aldose 1-dehydrogenase
VRVADRATIGRSSLEVSRLGLGTAPIGDLFTRLGSAEAETVVTTALDAGVTLVDTAPWYGLGLSEHRVGAAVRRRPRESVVLATKVGRVLRPAKRGRARTNPSWAGGLPFDARFDYGYDGVLRSYEDSLQRLGLDRVEMVAIHDLDAKHFAAPEREVRISELATGGARALEQLRAGGAVDAVGLGINTLGSIPRVLEIVQLDYAIVAMPYTLLDQDALDEELPLCLERGVSVIVGAVFSSGVLAATPDAGAYGYAEPPAEVRQRVARMREIVGAHGVSLAAVALQFPLGHPAVAAVVPGAVSAREVRENVEHFAVEIPADVWAELKAEHLLREDAPVPRG